MCVNCSGTLALNYASMTEALRRQVAVMTRLEAQLAEQERAKKVRKLQPKHRASLCGRTVRLRAAIDMGSSG